MKKIIPKIADILDDGDLGGSHGTPIIAVITNIDDIFFGLRKKNIREIKVSWKEMAVISCYLVAYGITDELREKILLDGEVPRFLGVKLVLDET